MNFIDEAPPSSFGPQLPPTKEATAFAGGSSGGASRTFGASVGTWETLDDAAGGSKRRADEQAPPPNRPGPKKRRGYDAWDAEIDRGHVRKTKANKEANRRAKLSEASRWLLKGGRGVEKKRSAASRGSKSSLGSAKKWL